MTDEQSPRPFVRRHHWIVRLTHWATVIVIAGMIASGLQIYEAYARFGNRGGPYFVSPFDGAQFPHWSRLGGWLAGALNWHFALAWPLTAFGLLYLAYLVRSGEWRALLFRPRDVPGALEMTKYYLHLRREHPPQGKHNPLQKLAYTGVIALGALAVLTGFAIYKPTQLSWLTALFGGFQAARRRGWREAPVPARALLPDVQHRRAQRDAAELFHIHHDADARGSGRLAPAGGRIGGAAPRAVARRPDAAAARVIHGQASLRRGVVGDRELARRSGVGHRRAMPPAQGGALHQFRLVRRRLLERLGYGERHAPTDDSRVRDERQPASGGARRTVEVVLADETRIQVDQVLGLDDVHGHEAGRVLGRSGISLVWRDLASTA